MRWLVALILVVPAAAGTDVFKALEKHTGVLIEEIKLRWLSAGLEPLRQGHRRIVAGDKGVRELAKDKARALIDAADIVLVTDLHQLDPCRLAFRRIVEEFVGKREFALALEAIPVPFEEHLAEARKGKKLLEFLQECWAWPVHAYADLLQRPKLKNAPVLAVGLAKPTAVPLPGTNDAKREPVLEINLGMSVEDLKYGASWHRRNMMAAASISTWIGKQKGKRKVFVLYGAAHYLGAGNIKEQLDKAGLKTVVLVPFLPAWEIALRKRFGNRAEKGWYEVLPGVLRAPFVTDDEIRKLG